MQDESRGIPRKSSHGRNVALDALRGCAALMVVIFHYLYLYPHDYPGHGRSPAWLRLSGSGVVLFFLISGYVIFMTLDRTVRPMDFVVSRLTRIYPAYWAAVALTFAVTMMLGLPGREVSGRQALANLTMLQEFLRQPDVDGAYWTLEVELSFYVIMLAFLGLHVLKGRRLFAALFTWLATTQAVILALPHIHSAEVVSFFTTAGVHYSHDFVAGICLYVTRKRPEEARPYRLLLISIPFLDFWRHDLTSALFITGAITLVWLASSPQGERLRFRPLLFLGYISYPLYLLHQYIGYALLRRLPLPGFVSVVLVFVCVLVLATLVTKTIERPAMRGLRAAYRRWRPYRGIDPVQLARAIESPGT